MVAMGGYLAPAAVLGILSTWRDLSSARLCSIVPSCNGLILQDTRHGRVGSSCTSWGHRRRGGGRSRSTYRLVTASPGKCGGGRDARLLAHPDTSGDVRALLDCCGGGSGGAKWDLASAQGRQVQS